MTHRPRRAAPQNIGMYRMQVLRPHHHGDALAAAQGWRRPLPRVEAGREASGCRWSWPWAATRPTMYTPTAPLPPGISEYLFGGFLRREPVYTAKALTADIDIPAEAEIVLEGYVDPAEELAIEGPFGDHTGFYSLAEYYPRFHVTTVTMRKNADLPRHARGPAAGGGRLPRRRDRADLPPARAADDAGDRGLPHARPRACSTTWCSCRIRKEYPGHAYKVMNGLWGMGLMSLAKVIVVVDEGIDVQERPRGVVVRARQHRPRSATSTSPAAPWTTSTTRRSTRLREQDGDRRHAEVAGGGLHPPLAGPHRDGRRTKRRGWTRCGTSWGSRRRRSRLPACRTPQPVDADCSQPRRARARRFAGASLLVDYSNFVKLPHTFSRCRSRWWAARWRRTATRCGRWTGVGGARVHLGALRGDGLQPDRGPRARREEPAHAAARDPGREADGAAGRGVGGGGGRGVPGERGDAEPALPGARAARAGVGALLLVHQALHPMGAPGAGLRDGDRAGGRVPRDRRGVERSGVGAAGPAGGVLGWGAGFDILYALQDEAFDRGRGSAARSSGWARGAAISRRADPRAASRAGALRWARGSALVLRRPRGWRGMLAYEHRLVRPGDLSRLDAAFFTMNGVMAYGLLVCVIDRVV